MIPDNVKVLVFIGGGTVESREGDLVTLTCGDGYEGLPHKTWSLLNYCNENCEFDFLIKIDDDTYVPDVNKLLSTAICGDYTGRLSQPPSNNSYHLKRSDVKNSRPVPWHILNSTYMGGPCYSLSRLATESFCRINLSEVEELNLKMAFEDVMVGRLMHKIPEITWFDDRKFIAGIIPWYVRRRGLSTPTVIVDLTADEIVQAHQIAKSGKNFIFFRLFLGRQLKGVFRYISASK